MDGTSCLLPTFQPPPRSLGRNQSNFDRVTMLLSGYSSKNSAITIEPVPTCTVPIVPTSSRISNKLSLQKSQNSFDLFDGEIIVQDDANTHQPRSTIAPLAAPSEPKRNVFSNGSTQKHLSSILNEIVDRGSLPSSRGEKRKVQESSVIEGNKVTTFTTEDFMGIEKFCRNGGASSSGLVSLQQKVQAAKEVALAVVWDDLSCNHVTTTIKYCTQSTKCDHWNCTCDRQIRANFASNNAIGVILRLPGEKETVYFLPLKECASSSKTAAGLTQNSNLLPMNCGTTFEERITWLLAILGDANVLKVLYHAQVALIPLLTLARKPFCLDTVKNVFDPRLAAYLCDSDIAEGQLELESLFDTYRANRDAAVTGGRPSNAISFAESAGAGSIAGSNRIAVSETARSVVGLGRVARAVFRIKADLDSLLALHTTLQDELSRRCLNAIFRDIEMPVACLLASMEGLGVAVQPAYLDHLRTQLTQQLNSTELQIYASVGEANRFNVASPEQVSRLLFETLALPPPSSSSKKGKHHSTSEEDLLKIRHLHPVVDLILNYRALAKVLTTYVDGMRPFLCKEVIPPSSSHALVNPPPVATFLGPQPSPTGENGVNAFSVLMNQARDSALEARRSADVQQRQQVRVHANWQQTIVRTGRLSCTKPNLQNIPNEQNVAGLVINVRSAFKASPGHILVSADYSQIEMRVLAHMCKDPVLLSLFGAAQGYDIYRHLAARILNRPVEEVPEEDRTKAKVICLGVLYGMGAQAAAAKLGIDVASASRITQAFFDHFKQIKVWIQQIKTQAKQYGHVRTLLGRVRALPDIRSTDSAKASYAERQAVNSVIQGTASDLIKYAMINVDSQLSALWPSTSPAPRLLMQIHDELIYEVSTADENSLVRSFEALLHRAMEEEVMRALQLTVPLIANIHVGASWGDLDN